MRRPFCHDLLLPRHGVGSALAHRFRRWPDDAMMPDGELRPTCRDILGTPPHRQSSTSRSPRCLRETRGQARPGAATPSLRVNRRVSHLSHRTAPSQGMLSGRKKVCSEHHCITSGSSSADGQIWNRNSTKVYVCQVDNCDVGRLAPVPRLAPFLCASTSAHCRKLRKRHNRKHKEAECLSRDRCLRSASLTVAWRLSCPSWLQGLSCNSCFSGDSLASASVCRAPMEILCTVRCSVHKTNK